MNTKRVSIAVAVTALGLALSPTGAFAADGQVQCGSPAKDAVYSTVVVPGHAAVSHDEYEWSLVTAVIEKQWQQWVVVQAAKDAVIETVHHDAEYETVVVPGDAAYDEQVLKTAAYDEQVLKTAAYDEQVMISPAVHVTEYKFVNRTGGVRWEDDPGWNAQPNNASIGWVGTGETREGALISEAVYTTVHHDAVYTTVHHDAVYDTVHHDAVYTTVHHDAVYDTVHHEAVYTTVHHDGTPDTTTELLVAAAWDEQVEVSPATSEVGHFAHEWSQESPGEGWEPTGETRAVSSDPQLSWTVEAPGDGWTRTGASRTVVDTPGVPESTTKVLVSEAVAAGAPCVDPADPAPAKPASAVPAVAGLTKTPATVNAAPTQLAFTGLDPALMWFGLGLFATGLALSAAYRKTAPQR